jgi:hypothetical protein
VITSGSNGYTAAAGYNLVTGLGTPVANLLIPDLIAYQGPGTSYSGPAVAPMQSVEQINSQAATGGPLDAFSVFDSYLFTSQCTAPTLAQGATFTKRATLRLNRSTMLAKPKGSDDSLTALGLAQQNVANDETRRAGRKTPSSALHPGAVDALIGHGWSARRSWITDRPRSWIKKFE